MTTATISLHFTNQSQLVYAMCNSKLHTPNADKQNLNLELLLPVIVGKSYTAINSTDYNFNTYNLIHTYIQIIHFSLSVCSIHSRSTSE